MTIFGNVFFFVVEIMEAVLRSHRIGTWSISLTVMVLQYDEKILSSEIQKKLSNYWKMSEYTQNILLNCITEDHYEAW